MRGGAPASEPRRRLHSLLGPPCLGSLGSEAPFEGALRWERHRAPAPIGCIFSPECRDDGVEVIPVLARNRSSVSSNFLDDGISARHDRGSMSSSGVQMIGGTVPASRHTSSILPRITAFARWRRFQVNKKSIPLTAATAACAASIRALAGNAPLRMSRRASVATLSLNSSSGYPAALRAGEQQTPGCPESLP